METVWHLSQINNNHPQVSVSKEMGQTQFQQPAIMFCAEMLCSSDTVQVEVKMGFPVFENTKNMSYKQLHVTKRGGYFSTDTLSR